MSDEEDTMKAKKQKQPYRVARKIADPQARFFAFQKRVRNATYKYWNDTVVAQRVVEFFAVPKGKDRVELLKAKFLAWEPMTYADAYDLIDSVAGKLLPTSRRKFEAALKELAAQQVSEPFVPKYMQFDFPMERLGLTYDRDKSGKVTGYTLSEDPETDYLNITFVRMRRSGPPMPDWIRFGEPVPKWAMGPDPAALKGFEFRKDGYGTERLYPKKSTTTGNSKPRLAA
jgi:hypothetical protein